MLFLVYLAALPSRWREVQTGNGKARCASEMPGGTPLRLPPDIVRF